MEFFHFYFTSLNILKKSTSNLKISFFIIFQSRSFINESKSIIVFELQFWNFNRRNFFILSIRSEGTLKSFFSVSSEHKVHIISHLPCTNGKKKKMLYKTEYATLSNILIIKTIRNNAHAARKWHSFTILRKNWFITKS